MTERQLEYVVAIAETGSFTAAAERCHVAQSALSHQIARLERHLGARLFDRTSRSVQLTDAGRSFLAVAQRILGEMADVRTELRSIDGLVRGPLRIGATQTAVRFLDLLPLLADYNKGYPDVELSVLAGPGFELVPAVRSGELDIAFGALDGPAPPPGVQFVPLGPVEPLVAVVADSHPLAGQPEVGLTELAAVSRFIDFRPHTALWNKVETMCEAAGVERQVMCELGNIPSMVGLAATGIAVTVVPRSFTEESTDQPGVPPGIRALPLAEPGSHLVEGYFCCPGALTSAPLRAFVELFTGQRHDLSRAPQSSD
jgi:DNA-binding transcriptional LysR family regulator